MWYSTVQCTHYTEYFFSCFFRGAIVRWSPYIFDVFGISCNRSCKHMWREAGDIHAQKELYARFVSLLRCLKRLIPFYDCTPTANYFFIAAVWLLKLNSCCYYSLFRIVQLSQSHSVSFIFRTSFKRNLRSFDSIFLYFFLLSDIIMNGELIFGSSFTDGFHSEAIKYKNTLFVFSQETE